MFEAIKVLTAEFVEKPSTELWSLISPLYMVDESAWLTELLPLAEATPDEKSQITFQSARLIKTVREDKNAIQMLDALLLQYGLNTNEGIVLMCLAEALMRIPDSATADALIKDKLSLADWKSHLKNSDSVFVNASTWGLMLSGKVIGLNRCETQQPNQALKKLINKFSEPVIRKALYQAMKIMGFQFVRGRDIEEALYHAAPIRDKGFTYSFDMLGEAACTQEDAKKYLNDYIKAIEAIGLERENQKNPSYSISIKLSALHPRYEVANKARVMDELYADLLILLQKAIEHNVAVTIDAEEADRLELCLALFKKLYLSEQLKGWGKLGVVVQAYSKRALAVLLWLNALAREQGSLIPVRLVKGAYWDSEIKWSQQKGYKNYPVFTRKEATDVSYLACARFLLNYRVKNHLYPQFASHNAHTIIAVSQMAEHREYEFQRLHGMGEVLYDHVKSNTDQSVRIYAPVGSHAKLLPYLVRRLLENGANSSFVNRLVDRKCPIAELTEHPFDKLKRFTSLENRHIPLPGDIFGGRENAFAINLDIQSEAKPFLQKIERFLNKNWLAVPIINGVKKQNNNRQNLTAPYDTQLSIGLAIWASTKDVNEAIETAFAALASWKNTPVEIRAKCLETLATLLEDNMAELVALCHQEAGKTAQDAIDEVREAVDFCRYYALKANKLAANKVTGFDGVKRTITREALGVVACISPWNFPLAIFLGQIIAALVAGNTVIAKPAEQTSLIATRAVELMLQAGFPPNVIALLPGLGSDIGDAIISHPYIAGVAFTGSNATAQHINLTLAKSKPLPVPFIAETGGQNAMIVDSTALPEQVVKDVMRSAFASAGQRCSALRVLFLQQEIADNIIHLLKGAMQELDVGVPYLYKTDVGPVIDSKTKDKLLTHIALMQESQTLIAQSPLKKSSSSGHFVAPCAFEISSINLLKEEQFGPILHIIRFDAEKLADVIQQINQTGFGLTLGIHSRNETTYRWIEKYTYVGNSYINRDQVGAVVGVQPFGGQGLSGTGPKAGGPHYLFRFTKPKIMPSSKGAIK